MLSKVNQGGPVTFPEFIGERVYMRRFDRGALLPADLARWQPTVDAMLDGIVSIGPVFLMVDQRPVRAGRFHRRPGLHVDGYWCDGLLAHGGNVYPPSHHAVPHAPGHRAIAPSHHATPTPGGGHRGSAPAPGHRGPIPGGHTSGMGPQEALIVASDVMGCRGFEGEWHGLFGNGGDCSDVSTETLVGVDFEPGRAWFGETGAMLHESVPLQQDALRTVVRLNVTNWQP